MEKYLNKCAKSVESGWVGKVIAFEGDFLKLKGINFLWWAMTGKIVFDEDDIQWFTPEDLEFIETP